MIFPPETQVKMYSIELPSRIVVNHFSEKKEWSLELPGKEEVSYPFDSFDWLLVDLYLTFSWPLDDSNWPYLTLIDIIWHLFDL